MESINKRTSAEDQRIASNSLMAVDAIAHKLKDTSSLGVKIQIAETSEFITIPRKALSLLLSIMTNMSEGKSISILPTDAEVSTQQAAEILNVSRPHLIKLLENNTIPFKKVGTHRRVLLRDVVSYEKQLQKEREKQLEFLAQQAQELELGY